MSDSPFVRPFCPADDDAYGWDDVPVHAYKPTGTHFRGITRQVLFGGDDAPSVEWRYFEVAPGGHSTFERHEHLHAVLILRGNGQVVVGDTVSPLATFDLVRVPPMTWHQFYATGDAPLGFLCLVAEERDRPQRPTEDEAAALTAHPVIGPHVRL
ncbi:MAG: cupin domain-containing protein [Rhodothermales bacterium]|jgi:quercetin dioxygenase-like cupin family protein|nr:cupin domain-containing protein [Rhodothermales bacterium]MCA0268961.1 cupin domain-containing protein [Bacteroidota bacterium]